MDASKVEERSQERFKEEVSGWVEEVLGQCLEVAVAHLE